MKNKKILKTLEKEIKLFALININRPARALVNRIFAYLRGNIKLLEKENYKKLYNECLIMLHWMYRKEIKNKDNQKIFEIVTDLNVKTDGYGCKKELFDSYFKFRLNAWNSGYYNELFE